MNRFSAAVQLALVFGSGFFADPHRASAATKPDASDSFFTNGYIPHLRIEITKANLDTLRRNERAYVRCTVSEGTNVWEEVGIHKKGAAGSNRDLNENPALSLNFDKFIDHQKFYGLDKFHLNNSVQDGSLICEAVCAQLFLDAGVPASRVTHARVELNGKDLGMYVLKEGFDKTFLKRYFKNPNGNLYDGGFLQDIDDPRVQRTSGPGPNNHADLKALVAAAKDPDPTNRVARLEKLLDLDRFLDFIALEVMTWHWDGYYMKRNNYRVYHDPDMDKITFFPHGMDQMFWQPNGSIFPNDKEGLVSRMLLEAPEGRLRYRQHMAALLTNVFTAEKITNHIALIQSRLQPVLTHVNKDTARSQGNGANNLGNLILARIKYLDRTLNGPPAKPLPFDADGVAALTKWEIPEVINPPDPPVAPTCTLDRATDSDGRKSLHIVAVPGQKCIGSWRTRVLLEPGRYLLEGRARSAGVTALTNDVTPPKGIGAGIRLSTRGANVSEARKNQLVGDAAWTKLEYEFTVPAGPDEKDLICELRASAGEAWFDLDSLKLRKKDRPSPDPGPPATISAPTPPRPSRD